MENLIKEVVDRAIKEDWFNGLTTSDLQGVCEAEAWNIFHKINPTLSFDDSFHNRMEISNKILEAIYEKVNPF